MKKQFLVGMAILTATFLFAQAPSKISFQAVIRKSNNELLTNTTIGMKISILQSSATGATIYSEIQSPTTNDNGLISIEIGGSAGFDTISWAYGPYFIKNETDVTGGTNYTLSGTSQLLSVPYALYAKTAKNVIDINVDGSETKIISGSNIVNSGNGTSANPYIINAIPDHYIGELFGGGVVFKVDNSGQHGLICSMVDLSWNQPWSNIAYSLIGLTAQSDWDGQSNSNAILGQPGQTSSAAKLCDDYINDDYGTGVYSDWYLPAIAQLNCLFNELFDIQKALDSDNNSSTTTLAKNNYWSSTEANGYQSYVYAYGGYWAGINKENGAYVRAVRNF